MSTPSFPQATSPPLLLVLSGPSGAGKSSIIERFRLQFPQFVESISATTRAPRGAEQDGQDYFFLSQERFQQMIDNNELLEHATVFGQNSYGTPRSFIEEQFAAGNSVIMDIDVQGARQLQQALPDQSCLVFVTPPSLEVLEQRLRDRGTDEETAIAQRLATAHQELAAWEEYDFLILNDVLDQAVADLSAIVNACQLAIH